VDVGESIEDALRREVKEEVNLDVATLRYLCSCPNRYDYRGVVYPTADLFFVGTVHSMEPLKALDEVESIEFVAPEDIDMDEIAFPSMVIALKLYIEQLRQKRTPARS
jgi:8-oxo-dGTP pyrophosphatase MutT (NUDIX family)